MAALTETQLQSACRAKLPITVVRDEDYTVLTPAQIAAAWTGYVGGSENIYMENLAGMWVEMDPDLPKANGRGLLVFGGGVQAAQRCDFADCTIGQAIPATQNYYVGGLTVICSDKGTDENGLPFIEITASGTPTLAWGGLCCAPGITKFAHAAVATGDIVILRATVAMVSVPVQVTSYAVLLYQNGADPANEVYQSIAAGTDIQTVSAVLTDGGQAIDYYGFAWRCWQTSGVAYATDLVYKVYPPLVSLNTAFPDHFHCINTSTSSAATIVPEVMQRPWEYEGPWSVEIEFETPPRNLGYPSFWFIGDYDNSINVYWNSNKAITYSVRVGGATVSYLDGPVVAENNSAKFVISVTAQKIRFFVNGTEYTALTQTKLPFLLETLGTQYDGVGHSFATFKSYKYRKGLATDAQLIEWSTLS